MSADYNGTDKSKCRNHRRPARSSPGKGRWPCWAGPGFCQSQAPHPLTGLPSNGLQQLQGLPCIFCYMMGLHAAASPPGGVKHTCLKQLERVQLETYPDHWKQGTTGIDFFYRWFIFHFKNYFLVWRNPWENITKLGDFLSLFSLKETKFCGISEQWKEDNWR